jgi:hypothetical protein
LWRERTPDVGGAQPAERFAANCAVSKPHARVAPLRWGYGVIEVEEVMTTTREQQVRSIRYARKRGARRAPGKGLRLQDRPDRRALAVAREALVKRVRSYLDVGAG